MNPDAALAELASKQWGVFARDQAFGTGLSKTAIWRRLSSGLWVEVQRRVYRHRGGIDSWHQSVCAAVLSLGRTALASHLTAGFLWGLDGLGSRAPSPIEITVPRHNAASVTGVRVHRSRRAVKHPARREGIALTPLARTLVDLAERLPEVALHAALNSAILRFDAVLIGVGQELAKAPHHEGAERLATLVEILQRESTESYLESQALIGIRLAGLPTPDAQQRIRTIDGIVFLRGDLVFREHRVVLHADSRLHHLTPEAFEKDRLQSSILQTLGWRDMRVTSRMLADNAWLGRLTQLLEVARQAHRTAPAAG